MSEAKPTLKARFKAMPAGQRTAIIGGGVVFAMFAMGTMLTEDGTGPKPARAATQNESLTIFNPGGSTATEAVAANLEAARNEIKDQNAKIALLEEQNRQSRESGNGPDNQWSEISNLVAQLQGLQEKVNAMEAGKGPGANAGNPYPAANLNSPLPSASTANDGGAVPAAADTSFQPAPPPAKVVIQVVGSDAKEIKAAPKVEKPAAYLPAGSNFESVLLSGMDASTAIGGNRNPTPALLRIKSDAILPNMFSFNVRECFVMVGGFGNISTERVEMRTESMSCISENGEVYEGKIEGYLVGEDGKAGARGRVVSKQGALLAKSFMAGFVGGIGNAFAPSPVSALDIMGGGQQKYQYPGADAVVGSGITTGLSKSAESLANFYIKLAEQMFPIVELDAGRKMTIILLKGVSLKMELKG